MAMTFIRTKVKISIPFYLHYIASKAVTPPVLLSEGEIFFHKNLLSGNQSTSLFCKELAKTDSALSLLSVTWRPLLVPYMEMQPQKT